MVYDLGVPQTSQGRGAGRALQAVGRYNGGRYNGMYEGGAARGAL